jgi:hypothetical protein
MPKYIYKIDGEAAHFQTWSASGVINTFKKGDFVLVPDLALKDAFRQLTNGKAVYGTPGVNCTGPYEVVKLQIERVKEL